MAEKIFYALPFRAKKLVQTDGEHQPPKLTDVNKCDLINSVRQNLRLLLMTPPARFRFDINYGCKIHWSHFKVDTRLMTEGSRQEDDFKVKIEQNVRLLIEEFEPRIELKEVVVNIRNAKEVKPHLLAKQQVKNTVMQIIVKIKGSVKEEYTYDGQSLELEDAIPLL